MDQKVQIIIVGIVAVIALILSAVALSKVKKESYATPSADEFVKRLTELASNVQKSSMNAKDKAKLARIFNDEGLYVSVDLIGRDDYATIVDTMKQASKSAEAKAAIQSIKQVVLQSISNPNVIRAWNKMSDAQAAYILLISA